MFTGIVEEVGKIVSVKKGAQSLLLTIGGNTIFDDLKIGDSVAVNGVCLTATSIGNHQFTADVMPESISMTTFTNLKVNQPVNLERAMAANARFGSIYDREKSLAYSILSRLNSIGIPIANDTWNPDEYQDGILQRVNTADELYPDGSMADYYGLINEGTRAGISTIIVEHAFLSNAGDYRNYLSSDAQLDALARADAAGILDVVLR